MSGIQNIGVFVPQPNLDLEIFHMVPYSDSCMSAARTVPDIAKPRSHSIGKPHTGSPKNTIRLTSRDLSGVKSTFENVKFHTFLAKMLKPFYMFMDASKKGIPRKSYCHKINFSSNDDCFPSLKSGRGTQQVFFGLPRNVFLR